jgi:hypothetical protein
VVFDARLGDVGRVAVVGEPEVFDEVVAEGFEDATVELVARGVRCSGGGYGRLAFLCLLI